MKSSDSPVLRHVHDEELQRTQNAIISQSHHDAVDLLVRMKHLLGRLLGHYLFTMELQPSFLDDLVVVVALDGAEEH